MKNPLDFTLIISLAIVLSACSSTPKSNEISPAYVPASQYQAYTCDQLVAEAELIRQSIPPLKTAVNNQTSIQNGAKTVFWILFWPTAIELDNGGEIGTLLSKTLGELQSIQNTLASKNCGTTSWLNEQKHTNDKPMKNSTITAKTICLLITINLLYGCASPASHIAMTVVRSDMPERKIAASKYNFEVRNVSGGQETNPLLKSQVDNNGFKEALTQSISRLGFSSATKKMCTPLTLNYKRSLNQVSDWTTV